MVWLGCIHHHSFYWPYLPKEPNGGCCHCKRPKSSPVTFARGSLQPATTETYSATFMFLFVTTLKSRHLNHGILQATAAMLLGDLNNTAVLKQASSADFARAWHYVYWAFFKTCLRTATATMRASTSIFGSTPFTQCCQSWTRADTCSQEGGRGKDKKRKLYA